MKENLLKKRFAGLKRPKNIDFYALQSGFLRTLFIPFVGEYRPPVSFRSPFIGPLIGCIKPSVPRVQRGFTIIELGVTLAIAGILLFMAIPSFNTFIQNNRLRSATADFVAAVHLARVESIKRQARVIMCRTGDPNDLDGDDAVSCREDQTAADNRMWNKGWIMYATLPSDSSAEADYSTASGHQLIKVGPPAPTGVIIRSDTRGDQRLAYYRDGTLNESSQTEYIVCDDRNGVGNTGRLIAIPLSGRPIVSETSKCDPESS